MMSWCAAGTNVSHDLRHCASLLDPWVGAEWSRCSGSMARRDRHSVAPLRRSSADWMPARIGRLSAGVARRHPYTIRKALLMGVLIRGYEHCNTIQERSALWLNAQGHYRLHAELLLQHPSRSQQDPLQDASVYAYFLKTVVGKSEM